MIEKNLAAIRSRIGTAARRSGRSPDQIKLVVVGKNRPVDQVRKVISLGFEDIGENRVQELVAKNEALGESGVRWHFIGNLQKNKVRQVVGLVELIHSVDSLELAVEIDRRAGLLGIVQPVLIQVNVAREATKQGVELKNLEQLVAESDKLRHIKTEGLMTIAPFAVESAEIKYVFARLKEAYGVLATGRSFRWLSMGMTNDFEEAIEEGANLVRVGRAVFESGI